MDGISRLREAIRTAPVPVAPPRMSLEGAAVGLGFLDAALRLNHVRRITERLTISQHRIAHRTTQVDLSVNMMTDVQLEAAAAFQALSSHSSAQVVDAKLSGPMLWVPVARLPRTDVGPIDVRDDAGHRLPRLTQYEISRLVASGLYQLLRGTLATHSEAQDPCSDLSKVLQRINEPRWLIQASILAVLTENALPQQAQAPSHAGHRSERQAQDQNRRLAEGIFDRYKDFLGDYAQLFEMAATNQIIVVALDPRADEHLLTYESPLYVNDRDRWYARAWRLLRASREGYYVTYTTDIPATLRSYHLVAEAASGINIRQLFLATNAAQSDAEALADNLRTLACDLRARRRDGGDGDERNQAVEGELLGQLHRLSELVRRRDWEANAADITAPMTWLSACPQLVAALEEHEADPSATRSLRDSPAVSAAQLDQAAREIEKYELGSDLALEKQPISDRRHGYWRRPPSAQASGRRTHVRACLLLRNNTAQSSIQMVAGYALAVAGITYAVAAFLTRSPWPFSPAAERGYAQVNSEVIAILLLVPGYLYTRLSLPETNTVAGHVRALPRLVAYLCIAAMVGVSAVIAAAHRSHFAIWIAFMTGTGVPVLSIVLLSALRQRSRGTAHRLARMGAPQWVRPRQGRRPRPATPDVTYSPTRSSP